MRNYLFAPFKDDDDKINEFNGVVSALKYVVDAEDTHFHESALHGLRVFMGRLESYYDVIIGKLSSENAVAVADEKVIKGLEDKVRELKSDKELVHAHKIDDLLGERNIEYNELLSKYNKLKAENEELKEGLFTADVDELKAEIKELKADKKTLLNKIDGLKSSDDIRKLRICRLKHDKLVVEIEELEEEYKKSREYIVAVEKENDTLKYENTKHYPNEYKEEARDFFNHNPNGEKLWFFMVGDSEVDEDGDVRKTLNVGVDAIAECDNLSGDVSVEVYK